MGFGDTTHDDIGVRGDDPCAGRLFEKYRIFTFWVFPKDREELFRFLRDLEKETGLDIVDGGEDWKIEVDRKAHV